MLPLIFIGPTLARQEALQFVKAEIRPPARQGDLNRATAGRLVAIIDGELPPDGFLPDCEIKSALDRGVTLYGAASVGASRAATFANQGMRGVGLVYEQYRVGSLSSFDEVAVLYDPFFLQVLSIPLVSVQFWLHELVAASIVTFADAMAALEDVRRLSLYERQVADITNNLERHLGRDVVQKAFERVPNFPDVKADDSRRLLRLLAKLSSR
jgi:hypothetical protein